MDKPWTIFLVVNKYENMDSRCLKIRNKKSHFARFLFCQNSQFSQNKRAHLGSPRDHTLTSPRNHTLTSPRLIIPSPHLDFLIHVFIPSLHLDLYYWVLTLPNLTEPNLCSLRLTREGMIKIAKKSR